MRRSLISIWIGASLIVLIVSGAYAFFIGYHSLNIFLHVLFGWLFATGAIFHFTNNLAPLRAYLKKRISWVVILLLVSVSISALVSAKPISWLQAAFETHRSGLPKEVMEGSYVYELDEDGNFELEVKAGPHFFYPQFALWLTDSTGQYLETILTTYSSATGSFYGGRTKENFKTLDKESGGDRTILRVDALPYWSHQRGVKSPDGFYAPSPEKPLVDAITGATPIGNFRVKKQIADLEKFKVLLEVNVAFDDNEYYSEYDFPEDSMYHSGAGLLGQPSLIYKVAIDQSDGKKYYLMEPIGHGHYSGSDGSLTRDLSTITTAREIFDRVILRHN